MMEEEEGKMATCSRNLKVETGVCRMRRSLCAVPVTPGTCCPSKEYELPGDRCCPKCYEGSVVKRDCTPQSDTLCVPCVDGTYMDRPNELNKCFPCSSCDQGRGLFAKQNCTSTSDTVCDVIAGHFCTDPIEDEDEDEDEECRSASKHSDCEPGHRVKEPGTRRTDTTCEPCPAGSFSPQGVNCSLWTNCSRNQVMVRGGNLTSNTVCGAALGGLYWLTAVPVVVLVMVLTVTLVVLWIKGRNQKKQQQGPRSSVPSGKKASVCLQESSQEGPQGMLSVEYGEEAKKLLDEIDEIGG